MWVSVALASALLAIGAVVEGQTDEQTAAAYIKQLDQQVGAKMHNNSIAMWDYTVNLTDANNKLQVQAQVDLDKTVTQAYQNLSKFHWENFQNRTLQRWFSKFRDLRGSALPEKQSELLRNTISSMQNNYATATICDYKNKTKCDLSLEPDIIDLFATSTDPEQLKDAFIQWHHVAGTKIKQNFTQYVTLKNLGARLDNFNSTAEQWLSDYESSKFETQLAEIWREMKPLYRQLHAYVRGKLRAKYGNGTVTPKGPIPGHLLSDPWGLTWLGLESYTRPYPNLPESDITAALKQQKYTPLKMAQMSDKFQQSLNLTAMPKTFYERSIFEKPTDGRPIDCHDSAWDFFKDNDVRILMCATVNYDSFQSIHHEMGHVQYFLQYSQQAFAFHDGANPGFHEAVGDTLLLSVISPTHLKNIGLIKSADSSAESEINHLYKIALDKIAFIPFAYLLENWRYLIFRGITNMNDSNCHYWHLKESIQGVEPPVTRTESDFDGGAKYHVAADVPYMDYLVAVVLQFQFHKALCELAGQYSSSDSSKQLYNCDISNSTAAGNAFARMLRLGASRPWPDAMEALTGQRAMSTSGLREFFRPLYLWLVKENNRTGERIGWEPSKIQFCTKEQKAAGLPKVGE